MGTCPQELDVWSRDLEKTWLKDTEREGWMDKRMEP